MGEERVIAVHIKAAEEYLEAARKLIQQEEYFASVLCAATGAERAAMALILYLGGRPSARHRHHETLAILQPVVMKESRSAYREVSGAVAELMGHLTMVRNKYEAGGQYKTPRQLYDHESAEKLYGKALQVLNFIKKYIG